MVAKSYQNLSQESSPYELNGKKYIKVRLLNNTIKQVRWYTEKEYMRMYPSKTPVVVNQKKVFGFDDDFITIFNESEGNDEENDLLRNSCARFCTMWGWYIISKDPVPSNIISYKLPWIAVGQANGTLKSLAEIQKNVKDIRKGVFIFNE